MSIRVAVWGDYACFSRPEMKVERVSYDVMTPSAARGLIDLSLIHIFARLTDHRLVDLDAGLAAGRPADLEGQVHQGPAGILLEGGHAGEGVFDRTALPIHLADRGGQPVVVAGIQQGHILGIEAQLKLELLEVLVVRGVDDVVEMCIRDSP